MAQQREIDPAARAGLRAYRRNLAITLVVGIAAFVAFIVSANIVDNRAEHLQKNGARVPGTVLVVEGAGEHGSVLVDFVWDDVVRRSIVHLDGSSPRYIVGEPVTVIVDRHDAHHITLPGETNQSPQTTLPTIYALVLGVAAMIVGTGGLVRAARQRRVLRRSPWRTVRARWKRGEGRRRRIPVLQLELAPNCWQPVRLAAATRWRLSKSRLRSAREVEIAGNEHYGVIRTPGSRVVMSAKAHGAVEAEALPEDQRPVLTMQARPAPTLQLQPVDAAMFSPFREVTRPPRRATLLTLALIAVPGVVVVAEARSGTTSSVALVLPAVYLAFGAWFFIRTATRSVRTVVDAGGVHLSSGRGKSRDISFADMRAAHQYPAADATSATRVVLELADGTNVEIATRRPLELMTALRGGHVFT